MPKFNHQKHIFTSGEISPKLWGRGEIPDHQHGARKIQNFMVTPQAGLSYRMGTRYVANLSSLGSARLIPFTFSQSDGYAIVLSNNGLRIYRNDGTLCTIDYSTTLWSAAQLVTAELQEWQYAQSADVLYLSHANHPPFRIARTGSTAFKVNYFWDATANLDQKFVGTFFPFRDTNVTTTTLTASAGSITASSPLFDPSHVQGSYPMLFRITVAGVTGIFQATSYVSSTQLNGGFLISTGTGVATSDWAESAWSYYRGFPRAVALFEGRLIYGGNKAQPDTLWASRLGNYDHFMQKPLYQDNSSDTTGIRFYGPQSDEWPFSFTLASSEVNPIQWMSAGQTLAIGTLGAEYTAYGGQDRVLSASNPSFTPQTNYGSTSVRAVKSGTEHLFVSRDGRQLRSFGFDPQQGGYASKDLTEKADHLVRSDIRVDSADALPQVVDVAFQPSKTTAWVLVGGYSQSRSLLGVTLDRATGVVAWHQHKLGGEYKVTSADTGAVITLAPKVSSLCVIPNSSGGSDSVWMLVYRYINGVTYLYLEKTAHDFTANTLAGTWSTEGYLPCYLDCAGVANHASAQTTHSGFTHLAGATVSVLADGKVHPDVTVSVGGVITTNVAASQIVAGFEYAGRVELLPIEAGAALGSAHGTIQRVDLVTLRFYNSVGCQVGSRDDNLERVLFQPSGVGQAVTPYTGIKRVHFSGGYEEDPTCVLVQDQPLPLYLVSVTLRGATNES